MPEQTETNPGTPVPRTPVRSPALAAHAVPFGAWIVLMLILDWIGPPAAWKYALRAAAGLALLVWLRPWRWYPRLQVRNLGWSLAAGVIVYLVWVLPEVPWGPLPDTVRNLYLKFAVLPLLRVPDAAAGRIYAPEQCGWALTTVRLFGSAAIIAVIEEFFWRGFLYRWLLKRDFTSLALDDFDLETFLIVICLFGLEHQRWLAGIAAGLCYGTLLLKTRDIWAACVAHALTNLLLGLTVLATGAYAFW